MVHLRDGEQNTSRGRDRIQAQQWGTCRAILPTLLPAALHGHTHTHFPPSFPTHLSPNVFSGIPLWAGSGALDSALTQIKETVLFLTYKYTLLILTPTVPGPVLTSGEPLALWAFVSSPKQQQRERERHPGFCCVPMHKALVIQQQGKG